MNDFEQILTAGASGLKKYEFWCITHRQGKLWQTASKDMTMPVQTFCDAMGVDWDEAVEQGYSLGKITLTVKRIEALPLDRLLGRLKHLAETH